MHLLDWQPKQRLTGETDRQYSSGSKTVHPTQGGSPGGRKRALANIGPWRDTNTPVLDMIDTYDAKLAAAVLTEPSAPTMVVNSHVHAAPS